VERRRWGRARYAVASGLTGATVDA